MIDFSAKGPPEKAPPGFLPWFEVPSRNAATHTVVCGHWSALGFRQQSKLLALDSGCLWGGSLTAVRLEDRRVFQLPVRREWRRVVGTDPPGIAVLAMADLGVR